MKTSSKLFITFGIIFALVVGFLIGIAINYPKVDESLTAGTIKKIKNYKATLNTKNEIQIKNELLSDTAKLKSLQNYLKFYYLTTTKLAMDIDYSIDKVNSVESFKTLHTNDIDNLLSYKKSLLSAKSDLLIAFRACISPDKIDPVLLKEFLNQSNNVIAQLNFRNSTVLDFINILALYINQNKGDKLQGLRSAHDLLYYNEINFAMMTRNKLILLSLNKKGYLSEVKDKKLFDSNTLTEMIQQDLERLAIFDREVLNCDKEKLGFMDSESLGSLLLDSDKLGANFPDSERLGSLLLDSEKLGRILDSETLGIIILDAEKLGILLDSETLKGIEIE